MLLLAGYSVVMMDSRAHARARGVATYGGWSENDTRFIVDALESSEYPRHLFALGESMGAGIALQSAAVSRALRRWWRKRRSQHSRSSYDYAGLDDIRGSEKRGCHREPDHDLPWRVARRFSGFPNIAGESCWRAGLSSSVDMRRRRRALPAGTRK